MPSYDYQCEDCGYLSGGLKFSIVDKPDTVECPECRGDMRSLIQGGIGVIVKDAPWDWEKGHAKGVLCPSMGRFERSDVEQGRIYDQMIGDAKTRAKRRRRDLGRKSDGEWQHVGKTPLEVHEGVVEMTGDKEIWQKDTENLLKKTGCWLGD